MGFDVGAADQVDAVRYCSEDTGDLLRAIGILQALEGFLDRFWLTWKIQNQRCMVNRLTDDGDLA